MKILLALAFAVSSPAHAAALLRPGAAYKVQKELKDAGPAPKPLASFYSELELDFESYDPNDSSGTPLLSTHSDQLMKLKRLPKLDPKDPAFPKDGLNDRLELTFVRLVNTSKVRVPGLRQPFETKSDLGALLAAHPLVIRGDGKAARKVDNLDQIRDEALAKAPDPATRTSVRTLLSENLLLRAGGAAGQDTSCLGSFARKKPGEKWSFSREEQGVAFHYDCDFRGWAEEGGKKIAVIDVRSPKQRTRRPQPNGVPGMAETEGEGTIYFEPSTQESLLRMETRITVEPTDEEIGRLKARGETIPRNRSVMKNWNHLYAL
jgi:hypothetical protein